MSTGNWFAGLAKATARAAGHASTFGIAVAVVLIWATTGPLFHFSDTWQLVINTGTTIITFLMVFLIQTTQNRDSRAIHLKLDELIRSSKARNVFADLEDATDQELDAFQREFAKLRQAGVEVDQAATQAHELARGRDDDSSASG